MFLKSLLAYFWVFSSREANSIVPLTDPSNANILPSNEKDHLLPTNHLLRKLFALIHTMSHSEMVFQNRTSFIILATLGTREKQRFCMSALYVPGQTAPVEIFLTVSTFHFATCNSILRGGTSAGFHELFSGAPSYCRSSWTLWSTEGTQRALSPCAAPWCDAAGLCALSTFGNEDTPPCLQVESNYILPRSTNHAIHMWTLCNSFVGYDGLFQLSPNYGHLFCTVAF